jgi:hypothetical protein
MKRLVIAVVLSAASVTTPANAADVGVSISVGQPGFYGQIDIGDFPRPQLIFAQPVVIEPRSVERAPIYLHVPPGHAKHWSKHCREYNACGERVYFVHDNWYDREYVPRYQERHGNRQDGRGNDRRDEERGDDNNGRHGHGKGNNKGEGRGRD